MDQKQVINSRQYSWLTASLLTGGGLVSIEQVLIRLGKMDSWGTYIFPSVYSMIVAYVYYQLARRFPGKHIFEITKLLFGSTIGTLVNLILLFHLWLILVRDLRSFGKFIGVTLLPNTPDEIILLLLGLLLMYYGKTSVEVVARVTDFFFPFFAVIILALPLMLSNELHKTLLQPVLAGPIKSLFLGNMVSLGWYGDLFVMGAFLHTLQATHQLRSAMRHGAFLASMLLGVFLMLEILVLGPTIPGNLIFPNYNLVQQIHITDFLDRMDLIILSIWFPITACEVILIYLAFLTGIASLVKQRDYSTINTPVALMLLLTSILAFKSTSEVFSFGNYSSPAMVIAYQPLFFLLIWLFALKHPVRVHNKQGQQKMNQTTGKGPELSQNQEAAKRENDEHSETRGNSSEENSNEGQAIAQTSNQSEKDASPSNGAQSNKKNKSNPAPSMLEGLSYQAWGRCSNTLIILNIAFLGIGLWLSKYHSRIGIACGIAYAIGTTLVVLTSYMELYRAKQQSQ